jgi:PhoH-like ATPase
VKKEKFLVDTNVIISFPSVFQHYEDLHVHLGTVEELDRLKGSDNQELGYRARKGAKLISSHLDTGTIIVENYKYGKKKVDDILLTCAKMKGYTLITNDLALRIRCQFRKIKSIPFTNGDNSFYTGIKKITINDESEISSYTGDENFLNELSLNQFVIFYNGKQTVLNTDGTQSSKPIKQYIMKDVLEEIKDYTISNAFFKKIKPRNVEQKCLFHALYDDKIKILCVNGGFGVGKSMLTISYAFQELERGKISKIVYVPNNASTANSREIAALPGGLLEKELIYMGSLVDIAGYEEVERRISEGTLELMPIALARGRNIEDAIILVNEAQNLTEEHIKLLIGRVGEGTKIFFDGDIYQSDKPIFRNSNGLKLLYKLKDSPFADLFSTVKLTTIERSRTAQASQYLDTID